MGWIFAGRTGADPYSLTAGLQEQAVSGRQQKIQTNPFRQANSRAQQPPDNQEDAGVVQQRWDRLWSQLPNGSGFVLEVALGFFQPNLCA